MRKLISFLFILATFSSCANLIKKLQSDLQTDIDQYDSPRSIKQDTFEKLRSKNSENMSSSQSFQIREADENFKNQKRKVRPKTKREYHSSSFKMRHSSDDLNDNGNQASLWTGKNQNSFLFSNDRRNNIGDIILINIEEQLKNNIVQELYRIYPDIRKKQEDAAASTTQTPPPTPEKGAEAISKVAAMADIEDRFTSVVTEEINKNHLLLKGRKKLLFKKRKRLVEIQALVTRNSLQDDDSINSSTFLESSIKIIR